MLKNLSLTSLKKAIGESGLQPGDGQVEGSLFYNKETQEG